MSTTESSPMHIEISFKENDADITCRYVVTAEMLLEARRWSAQRKPPADAQQTNMWFRDHGAKLDSICGPAYIESRDDGTRIEAYYHEDKLDRVDDPAIIGTYANGTSIEQYYHDGKRDRADGPAWVETYFNGLQIERWYRDGEYIKEETLAPLKSLPGVKILDAPAP